MEELACFVALLDEVDLIPLFDVASCCCALGLITVVLVYPVVAMVCCSHCTLCNGFNPLFTIALSRPDDTLHGGTCCSLSQKAGNNVLGVRTASLDSATAQPSGGSMSTSHSMPVPASSEEKAAPSLPLLPAAARAGGESGVAGRGTSRASDGSSALGQQEQQQQQQQERRSSGENQRAEQQRQQQQQQPSRREQSHSPPPLLLPKSSLPRRSFEEKGASRASSSGQLSQSGSDASSTVTTGTGGHTTPVNQRPFFYAHPRAMPHNSGGSSHPLASPTASSPKSPGPLANSWRAPRSGGYNDGLMPKSGYNDGSMPKGLQRDGSAGSEMFVAEPRKPRAQRLAEEEGDSAMRDRRKSERRLSKGAQIAWSGCQIIESKELRLLNAIGAGAYGKVSVCGLVPLGCGALSSTGFPWTGECSLFVMWKWNWSALIIKYTYAGCGLLSGNLSQ